MQKSGPTGTSSLRSRRRAGRRTAKGPEEEPGEKREESRQAVTLFSVPRRKESQSGEVLNARLELTRKRPDDRSVPINGRKCLWTVARGGNDRNGLPVFIRTARCWGPHSERESSTFFVPGTKPVDTPFPRGGSTNEGGRPSGNRTTFGKASADFRITCQNPSPHPGLPPLGKESNGPDNALNPRWA
jgi:hypothetical protein